MHFACTLHVQELFAREENLKIKAQGQGTYLVTHKLFAENKKLAKEVRNTVDIEKKTCTCPLLRKHRMPCGHVLLVLDSLRLRDDPTKFLKFRKDWFAPYFFAENYCAAYSGLAVAAPNVCAFTVRKGERKILRPNIPPKGGKRTRTKRRTKGEGGRRSRAMFNVEEFVQRRRNAAVRTGPANGFVQITDRNIFRRKPCGRKPLSREERSAGIPIPFTLAHALHMHCACT